MSIRKCRYKYTSDLFLQFLVHYKIKRLKWFSMSLMKSILTAKDGIGRRGMIQLANFIFGRLLSKAISHLSKEKGPFSFVTTNFYLLWANMLVRTFWRLFIPFLHELWKKLSFYLLVMAILRNAHFSYPNSRANVELIFSSIVKEIWEFGHKIFSSLFQR